MTLKAAEQEKLGIFFKNVHAIAKQGRPIRDFVWMAELDKSKGLDVGSTYLNEKAAVASLCR